MSTDEILDFLGTIQTDMESDFTKQRQMQSRDEGKFPYKEKYLEYLVSQNSDVPDRYYTMLAELYIDSLFSL
jgi:hypothetical protein